MPCCNKNGSKNRRQNCPECGGPCPSVSVQTMLHQIQFPESQSIKAGDYAFCSNQQCPVGYFASSHRIPKQQLRIFKGNQKTMLCYCYGIEQSHYQTALKKGVSEPIKAFVIQQTKSNTCACEIRNPSGRCCLADFKRLEKNVGSINND